MQVVSRFIDHATPTPHIPVYYYDHLFYDCKLLHGSHEGFGPGILKSSHSMRHHNRYCASVAYYEVLQSINRRLREEYWLYDVF